jgi:hypothetical protein
MELLGHKVNIKLASFVTTHKKFKTYKQPLLDLITHFMLCPVNQSRFVDYTFHIRLILFKLFKPFKFSLRTFKLDRIFSCVIFNLIKPFSSPKTRQTNKLECLSFLMDPNIWDKEEYSFPKYLDYSKKANRESKLYLICPQRWWRRKQKSYTIKLFTTVVSPYQVLTSLSLSSLLGQKWLRQTD